MTPSFTPREEQIAGLVFRGLRGKEIAYELGITHGTVKVYLSKMYGKFHLNGRIGLMNLWASRHQEGAK